MLGMGGLPRREPRPNQFKPALVIGDQSPRADLVTEAVRQSSPIGRENRAGDRHEPVWRDAYCSDW